MTEHETDEHLEDIADGSGCTEIWEHLSEKRDEESEVAVEETD